MSWLESLLLGIVQGLTEFLPVSSSGHLLMAKEFLGIDSAGGVAFEVLVHAATVLSTLTVFRRDVAELVAGVFKFRYNKETDYVLKIAVSMIPVLIVGLFFKDEVEALFGEGPALVGSMLLLTATLLLFSHFAKGEGKPVGYGTAFIVGIAQACAVLPGLSRSGSTISAGLLSGIDRSEIARFSFLMVLVPILGEAFLELAGGEFSPSASGISLPAMTAGFVGAYLSGLFACKLMIRLVVRIKLYWFSVYCAAAGTATIVYSMCG
ncbi:MAG: undecaprenyl-diphosphate phosphatase [Prevotellaceae bacterium]|jgi:undecaprenyl-diphosphatase|nr:undecaprenyl-diphosphate phosphatase [Prevotellaceae bacterium]